MENHSMEKDLKTGTTTVGVIGKKCVVLAADMKATMGNLSYEEEAQKVYSITDYTAVTNAGAVGDSLVLIRFLRSQARLYETERETKMTPKAMSSFLSNILNSNRHYPYVAQFILGGMLEKPELYELTPYGGVLPRKAYAVSGSGTHFALGVLDQLYEENMTEEQTIKTAIRAVMASKRRDIYSGGKSITVMVIDSNGIRNIENSKVESIIQAERKKLKTWI